MRENIRIRSVDFHDSKTLLNWRLAGQTREWQLSSHVPTPTEHEIWFKARLASMSDSPFFAVEHNLNVAAFIRFDHSKDFEFVISIVVNPDLRGSGLSHEFLNLACTNVRQKFPTHVFRAIIHRENKPSLKLFEKCGFMFESDMDKSFSNYVK